MEDDLLALDAQLPDTAWVGGAGGQDEQGPGVQEACQPQPTPCSTHPAQPQGRWERLTHKATAQPCLGDGSVVRVATQIQLLIQVQALELALGRRVEG